jgi:hypothetical protein
MIMYELSPVKKSKQLSDSIVLDINKYISTNEFSNAIFIDLKKQQNLNNIFNYNNNNNYKDNYKPKNYIFHFFKFTIYILCSIFISYSIVYLGLEIKHSNFNELNGYMRNIGSKLESMDGLNKNLINLNNNLLSPNYNKLYNEFKDFSDTIKSLNLKIFLNYKSIMQSGNIPLKSLKDINDAINNDINIDDFERSPVVDNINQDNNIGGTVDIINQKNFITP